MRKSINKRKKKGKIKMKKLKLMVVGIAAVVMTVINSVCVKAIPNAGSTVIYTTTMLEQRIRENYPSVGIFPELQNAMEEGKVELEKMLKEERKQEKLRKQQEKERKKKEKEEKIAAMAYKEAHPHYEIFNGSSWVHMPTEWQDYLKDQCDAAGLDIEHYKISQVQLYVESEFNPNVVSPTMDYGMAQINQCNLARLSSELGVTNFLDPYQSIKCNIYMMSGYYHQYTISQALSKYNTGSAYDSTTYSRKILGLYNNGAGMRIMQE